MFALEGQGRTAFLAARLPQDLLDGGSQRLLSGDAGARPDDAVHPEPRSCRKRKSGESFPDLGLSAPIIASVMRWKKMTIVAAVTLP